MKALLCFLIALCALASQASAKAYFQSKKEMIETAEVIAVITIADVKAAEKTASRISPRWAPPSWSC